VTGVLAGETAGRSPTAPTAEKCLKNTGDQYNRALQDLVSYIGPLLKWDTE